MRIPADGSLLRVFLSEADQWQGRPAYEAIVLHARELHVAGATVFKGLMGYGARSRLHSAKVLRLSEDLPVVIEIVDSREKLEALLPFIDQVLKNGLVTLERAEVIWYRAGLPDPGAST